MCRGRSTYRSTSRVPSPNAARAVRRADSSAAGSSSAERTSSMPLPPPPADGLTSTGKPMRRAASARSSSGSAPPGSTGTPAAATVALARILSPIASIAPGGGPTNTSPARAHRRANAAFSARKP